MLPSSTDLLEVASLAAMVDIPPSPLLSLLLGMNTLKIIKGLTLLNFYMIFSAKYSPLPVVVSVVRADLSLLRDGVPSLGSAWTEAGEEDGEEDQAVEHAVHHGQPEYLVRSSNLIHIVKCRLQNRIINRQKN